MDQEENANKSEREEVLLRERRPDLTRATPTKFLIFLLLASHTLRDFVDLQLAAFTLSSISDLVSSLRSRFFVNDKV